MKKLRIILSALAFVFAMTAAFAFVQQQGWYKPSAGAAAIQGTITVPSNTDEHPCSVQSGTQCKVGSKFAFSTEQAANDNETSLLLKYN